MTIDATTRELVDDCLLRISKGDKSAAFDLASVFMSHVYQKDVDLNLSIIEALALLAASQDDEIINKFINTQWPVMKESVRRRLLNAGFIDAGK